MPCIELLDGWDRPWLDHNLERQPETLLGAVYYGGRDLRFHAAVVDRMSEGCAADLIAHELAHVALFAQGDQSQGGLAELRADDLMSSWGFDPYAIDEWDLRNVRRWTPRRGIRWHEPPLSQEQVGFALRHFRRVANNPNYLSRRGQMMDSVLDACAAGSTGPAEQSPQSPATRKAG